jgi:antitoxin component YwqK of YwqJK toxin-antitoxin module
MISKQFLSILIFLLIFFVSFCKSEKRPEGVPNTALYDRKTNMYSVTLDLVQYKYYRDGKLYSRCEVNESGQLHGMCEAFLHSTGQKISWGNFLNGQRHGEWTWAFEDGSPYVVQNFAYGKKKSFWIPVEIWGNDDGPYARYYFTGDVEEKGFFDSGYKTGKWVKYYPNRTVEYRGNYLNGSKVGAWQYFYPNGSQEAMEEYTKEGKLIFRNTYYPNGNLWCKNQPNEKLECREP